MKNVIRSHYIPKVYLKNFSFGKSNLIYMLDKFTKKVSCCSISSVAREKRFYHDSNSLVSDIEKFFDKNSEKTFRKLCNKLISSENLNSLSENDKSELSFFVALQWLRVKRFRSVIKDAIKEILSKDIELSNHFQERDMDTEVKKLHLETILERLLEQRDNFKNKKWVLFINETDMPFVTSDNPINFYNKFDENPYGNIRINSKDTVIYFPLTPKFSIHICDAQLYSNIAENFTIKDIRHVASQNELQFFCSTKYIFSKVEKFQFLQNF